MQEGSDGSYFHQKQKTNILLAYYSLVVAAVVLEWLKALISRESSGAADQTALDR